ncbi:hypothetical protein ACWPMX_07970 [Tsuneonella sp. HG094]
MTAPARITKADIARATECAVASGVPARIVLDLNAQRIEIILGESAPPPEPHPEDWEDDDT